jgi:hypothetical protein
MDGFTVDQDSPGLAVDPCDSANVSSRSRRAPPLVFYTSCSVGCVWGFWWFPPFDLHVYSSMWSEAEALSEYGVVPE